VRPGQKFSTARFKRLPGRRGPGPAASSERCPALTKPLRMAALSGHRRTVLFEGGRRPLLVGRGPPLPQAAPGKSAGRLENPSKSELLSEGAQVSRVARSRGRRCWAAVAEGPIFIRVYQGRRRATCVSPPWGKQRLALSRIAARSASKSLGGGQRLDNLRHRG